ncbi:MAG: nucleoside-diphosphate kinase, partial [Actinomycetes bacterium]
MCKPDAVERGLVGEIVSRIERKGLRIVALELRTADRELAAAHYESVNHDNKMHMCRIYKSIRQSEGSRFG